jgi:hypothetical protein
MRRAALVFASFPLLAACTPELGDTPFACTAEATCPEGYTCRSSVCVKEGASSSAARPKRVQWINAGEMFWLPGTSGGAVLVVNDGFTPDAHGLYEIRVAPDGSVSAPKTLLTYGDQAPMASSVVALSDGRYGVVTLSFPSFEGDLLSLKVLAIDRDTPPDVSPTIETLYSAEEPYLGGVEPAYVSAIAGSGSIDLAWTRPSQGGRVEVLRLERQGALWQPTITLTKPLHSTVLPLSGDCLLWKVAEDKLVLRVGYESFAAATVDMAAQSTGEWMVPSGLPIFAWDGQALLLRYGEFDEKSATAKVSYALTDLAGVGSPGDDGGVLQDGTDVYAALPYEGGALFAPVSSDPGFAELGVGWRSPSTGLKTLGSVKRTSNQRIYSARAFGLQGRAYVSWTEFHESLMDLWVAVVPLAPVTSALLHPPGDDGSATSKPSAVPLPPVRVGRWSMNGATWRKP